MSRNCRGSIAGLVLLTLGAAGFYLWLAQVTPQASANYTEIEEGLFLGGFVEKPPPGTSAVLNVCELEDPYQCEVQLWKKIPDAAPAPSIDWLRETVEFVDTHRKAERITYVHCRAGISRSGMVVAAYLMHKNGWTRDEALAYIRKRRDVVQPNPAFMQLLEEWEAVVRKSREAKSGLVRP